MRRRKRITTNWKLGNQQIYSFLFHEHALTLAIFSINLRKEVADGLRIYFDFVLKDYLLYKQELEQASNLLSNEYLKNFTYVGSEKQ